MILERKDALIKKNIPPADRTPEPEFAQSFAAAQGHIHLAVCESAIADIDDYPFERLSLAFYES